MIRECNVIGCLVYHRYEGQAHMVVHSDSVIYYDNNDVAPTAKLDNNAKEVSQSVFDLWQGLHLGVDGSTKLGNSKDATLNAFGQVRFALAKDLIAGLKVSLPFGMSGVRYEVNLAKRVF